MNEFEEILKIFGKLIMAFFALLIGIIFFSTLKPIIGNSIFLLGLGFILIFVAIIGIAIAEIIKIVEIKLKKE